jgi:hypothetical protein
MLKYLPVLVALASPVSAQTISERDFARSLSSLPQDQVPALDALRRPVRPDAQASYDRVVGSIRRRTLSADEKAFLLALLNNPPMAPGAFKDREQLARFFAEKGVAVASKDGSLTQSDLWRLVRAARAAAQAFQIPPSILLCLTFQESGFQREASAWTTTAKGVSQMTNPAVEFIIWMIRHDKKRIKPAAEEYARLLGAKMPDQFIGTPDVDKLTKELDALRKAGASKDEIAAKKAERKKAILAHKDEPGSIYNIETNFGLGAAYLADIRYNHLKEVPEEKKGWLTAVGGYNQGMGIPNELIYKVYGSPEAFNAASIDEIYNAESLSRLSISKALQEEMLGEVGNVRRCALP